jgi:hypothetical protein
VAPAGRLGSGATGAGPGAAEARGAVGGSGGTRRYTTRGRDAREREKAREKRAGQGRVCSLMFIGPTHQPTNISGLAYVAAVVPYVRRPPDEHKLHTSV